jgi:hypothetical protein
MAAQRAVARQPSGFDELRKAMSGPAEIDPPEVESLGSGLGYVARFPKALARITIDGLRRGREGPKGDVRVEVGPFGDGRHRVLTEGRLELSSISQRESWERRLTKRWNGADWGAVLDRFTASIIQAEKRLDEPAIYLRDARNPPRGNMALASLVLANLTTLWFGADGTLKSYAALAAAMSLHTGLQLLGSPPAETMRVGYANFEPFDAGEHKVRMRRLLGFRPEMPDTDLPDLVYIDCYGSNLADQVERIQRVVRAEKLEFLVLDSIGFAADGPLNEDETARRFWQSVGQIGLPMLATGHTPKEAESVFGSRFWRAGARLAWHVAKFEPEEHRDHTACLRFVCQKASVEETPAPVALTFDFSDGCGVRVSAGKAPEHGDPNDKWHDRIASVLRGRRDGTCTYAELALQLGTTQENVRRAVSAKQRMFVVHSREGSTAKRVALRARQDGPND